ncbi:MAG: ABC transporter permease [Armatimonadetes bacterium]|nr:ABC transporter permease [Armatimonadota bacterium]MDW8026787.1 ABC transporter permease [Armatimonadota bacterium]
MAQATKALIAVKPKETFARIGEWLAVTLAIALREVRSLFSSWVAYVTLAFFEIWAGFFFFAIARIGQTADMRYLFWNMAVILFIVLPMVTMRLLAEERRLGTLELLLTSPVTDWQVVLGKFLGAYYWLIVALGLTLYVPYLVYRFSGGTVDLGPYWTAYIGLLLFGAAAISVGVFWSALTDNQIIAAFTTFGTLLLAYVITWPTEGTGTLAEICRKVSLYYRFQDFTAGLIQSKDVTFFLLLTFAFLYLSVQVLGSRRWR